jgi:hypothetical protein
MLNFVEIENQCPVLTMKNVMKHLKNTGVTVRFSDGVKLKDLDPGVFGTKTRLIKSDKDISNAVLQKELKVKGYNFAGFLNLAEILIRNPKTVDNHDLIVQNLMPQDDGSIIYAVAFNYNGIVHVSIRPDYQGLSSVFSSESLLLVSQVT